MKVELPFTLFSSQEPYFASAAAYHSNILSHFYPQGYTSASALLTLDLYRARERVEVSQSELPIILKFQLDSSITQLLHIKEDIFEKRTRSFD